MTKIYSEHSNTCMKCGEIKPWSEFPKQPSMKMGRKNTCTKCYNEHHLKVWHIKRASGNISKKRPCGKSNPERESVRRKTRRAILRGELRRGPCEVCGVEKSEAHHDDYSNPLGVRWLCRKHHAELHRTRKDIP